MIIDERTLLRDPVRLEEFLAELSRGAVVIYPSETIYSIGGALSSAAATEKIFTLKARDSARALFAVSFDLRQVEAFGTFRYDLEYTLFREFGHNGLTVILDARPFVSVRARGGAATLGLRLASTELCSIITERLAEPLSSTSATLSNDLIYDTGRGDIIPRRVTDIPQYLLDEVEYVVDGGERETKAASTVVRVTAEDRIVILREGVVPTNEFERLGIRIDPAEAYR